ncbi:hypothetical protein DDQ41_20140 [Streptomyces spongiicola]|uniref:Hydrogenase expression protein HypF n=1 Tax=Streptomyces spongiicola TaxID=1690221 RepID=A0ABM6VA34_9ACTN|nr:hypothetical protein [Streptomyces spongiicola]AWK10832.1 hypothetical protein DDQ41_20140 [Streptomyces spongiicola]
MPGDGASLTAADGDPRRRGGPRHAAPRRSLLTKLQIPAGKAMAIAAMPTAVFVGMGLTPKPALADDKQDIPFAPGPCVTRSDEPEEPEASPSASEPEASPSGEQSDEPSEGRSDRPVPSPGGSADERTDEPEPGESPSASASARTDEDPPEQADPSLNPTPSGSGTRNPLDPPGVGDVIGDLLDGPGEAPEAAPAASVSAGPAEERSEPAEERSEPAEEAPKPAEGTASEPLDEFSGKPAAPVEDAAGAAGQSLEQTREAVGDAIRHAAGKAGVEVEELDDEVKGLDPVEDEDIPEGAEGKPRFPCPTADPEALANAEAEPGIPALPDDPWVLESSRLTLKGLDYKGIVEVRTGSGKIKKVLKFTASGVDIRDLHQLVEGPEGTTIHVEARRGSTSTIRNGTVTMYTEELKGNLFGIIPVTFSPKTPPPLNVPFAMFTDVRVTQAGQFGGTLTVPGLHNYFTG